MDIEFLKSVKRRENLSILRSEINDVWVNTKITNYLSRNPHLGLTIDEIKIKILEDDLVGSFFAKDPGRQNISEGVIGDLVSKLDLVSEFINHPSSVSLFVIDGNIVTERTDGIKSIDYSWKTNGKKVYSTQKYTNEAGGAQDHQFNEVVHFMNNCRLNQEHFFIALVDGNYYTENKMNILKKYETENVRVCGVADLDRILKSV